MSRGAPAATKFVVPGLPHTLVARPGLFVRLDEEIRRPITLVTGVPGAGKTVLLASWTAARPSQRVAWLSCDSWDSDATRFWLSLITALRTAEPDAGLDALDVFSEEPDAIDDIVAALINDLASRTQSVVLVIDDFHVVPASALAGLSTFVERIPATVRIVIASRADPVLPLQRWRVRGLLGELRDHDLRLDIGETEALIAKFDIEVPPEDARLLATRTEGWAAGVQVAALSLRDREDRTDFIRRFAGSERVVADFLIAEVLDRQSPDMVDLLLATSVVDDLDADLCAYLTGREDAGSLLREAESLGLFVVPLDGPRRCYRYHHLFRDLLRVELRARNASRATALHHQAAEWYYARGDATHALQQFMLADDVARAFDLLHENLAAGWFRGIGADLGVWVEALPESVIGGHAMRMVDYAIALGFVGRVDEQGRWLRRAERARAHSNEAAFDTRFAAADAFWHVLRGEPDEAIEFGTVVFPSVEPGADPIIDPFPLALARGYLYRGDLRAAASTCEKYASSSPDDVTASGLGALRAWTDLEGGNLLASEAVAQGAITAAEQAGVAGHVALFEARLALGALALEHDQLDEAERRIEDALSRVEKIRPAFELLALVELAAVLSARGELYGAFDALARARAALPPDAVSPLRARVDAAEARLRLDSGDASRAADLVASLPPSPRRSLLEAIVRLTAGDPEEATACVGALDHAELTLRLDLERSLLRARIGLEQSLDVEPELRRAVELARSQGFVRTLACNGPEIDKRVADVLTRSARDPFSDTVLAAMDRATGRRVALAPTTEEILSKREQTVLRYLPTRMTTREIANELYVSMNTLKTHLKSIYRKLDASSRSEAVAHARTRGLL